MLVLRGKTASGNQAGKRVFDLSHMAFELTRHLRHDLLGKRYRRFATSNPWTRPAFGGGGFKPLNASGLKILPPLLGGLPLRQLTPFTDKRSHMNKFSRIERARNCIG